MKEGATPTKVNSAVACAVWAMHGPVCTTELYGRCQGTLPTMQRDHTNMRDAGPGPGGAFGQAFDKGFFGGQLRMRELPGGHVDPLRRKSP
jgi:hypothetical protein